MSENVIGIDTIRQALPHRYPFLLVDRVLSYEKDKRITAIKNVSVSEPYFTGHFPAYPVMPGVLIVEALAQACGVLMFLSSGLDALPEDGYTLLTGVDSCRFRRIVQPGDQLVLHAELQRRMRSLSRFSVRAEVDGDIACDAILTSVRQDG